MSKGLVYILTNPCLDGWVKIGMTERNDINKRLQELNSPTNIPLSYRCYAVYEVENPRDVEKKIHSIIDRVDNSLHAREPLDNGKIREREFFKISPETAYGIFRDIAGLRGDVDERKTKRSNNTFKLLNINIGEEITFLYDDTVNAKVVDDKNQVEYEDGVYSVTSLACKLLKERHGWSENLHVNGWMYFTKNGISLTDLRDSIENLEDNIN